MRSATWLVFVHATNGELMGHAEEALHRMHKGLQTHVQAYVITFGPTMKSDCTFRLYKSGGEAYLLQSLKQHNFETVVPNLVVCVDHILKSHIPVHGVCFWSHGGTTGLGKWSGWSRPFLTVVDAVRVLIRPFPTAQFVAFDACDQGNMSTLYEMPRHVQVVVASPEFHPFCSVLWTRAFGQLQSGMTKSALLHYGHQMTCEWHTFSRESWRGLLVFDMDCVRQIAAMLKQCHEQLVFDRKSQIEKEDANIHDGFTACRNLPHLQKLMTYCVRASCEKCIKCWNKKIHGPSMDGHLPRKWIDSYKSTKWYKEIVGGRKGFELWRRGW